MAKEKSRPLYLAILVWLLVIIIVLYLIMQLKISSTLTYYLVLLAASLAAAAITYLISKRSKASFTSDSKWGKLELSGPAVVFFLVLIGGYYLPGKFQEAAFDLTMNVYNEQGEAITSGALTIQIDNHKELKQLDNNGQAVFSQIPFSFKEKTIKVEPMVKGYSRTAIDILIPREEKSVSIHLQKKQDSLLVTGTVMNNLNKPVINANINFMNGQKIAMTDSFGNYSTSLGVSDGEEIMVVIYKGDMIVYNNKVIISKGHANNFYLE